MSASEPPPEFVSLWPISRGPLQSGHIVRLVDGTLAEWYPLPEGWKLPVVSGAEPNPSGPKKKGPREFLGFQPTRQSSPGWILLPRSDDPTLDKLLAELGNVRQKSRILKGFAAFIRSRIDKEPVYLHPALIFAPGGGILQNDILDLETWNYPSSKGEREVWSDFFSAEISSSQEALGPAVDAGKWLQLADLLVRKNDPAGAASFLDAWASEILQIEKKRQKETRIFWGLAVAVMGLILGCALVGRFAREQFQVRVRAEKEIRQNEALRSEQIKSLTLWGKRMREALPHSSFVPLEKGQGGIQLSQAERRAWQDWLSLASTFETPDNSEPELMLVRAEAHLLLGQGDHARQLWIRVASGTGPRAALACLALANGSVGNDGSGTVSESDRKGWLDQADNVLNPEDDSPFTDMVRAQIGFSQERFCLENHALPEAEKLRSESLDLVWELVETRTKDRHSELAPYALTLLLEHLDPKDRKLAKVGNLLEDAIARNPGFFDLYRAKKSRMALLQGDAITRVEKLALGLAHYQTVALMAGRFPERLEKRPEEILSALDLVDELTLMVVDAPPQNGAEEIWIWAMDQTQSLLNVTPRDPYFLRLLGRSWVTGARVAERIPGSEGVAYERLDKGLVTWNLLERLQGQKEEIRLARARTLAEMGAISLRMSNPKQVESLDNACQTILATLLQENPGAIAALDTHFRSRWLQAIFELSKKEIKRAKLIVDGLTNRVSSFPGSRDPVDQKQLRLLLIQAKLLELNLAVRESAPKDLTIRFKELNTIRDFVAKVTDDSDTRDELARIRARLALLEWSLGPNSMGKPDPSKPGVKAPGTTPESLQKRARELVSQAVWEPWEGRNLYSIWKPVP